MHRFNTENARLYAAKAVEARRRNKELRKQQPVTPIITPLVIPGSQPDEYVAGRIKRVRKQISMLDALLENTTDAKELDKLAAALSRLCEIERTLSGRPNPGSFKPVRDNGKKPRAAVLEPLE